MKKAIRLRTSSRSTKRMARMSHAPSFSQNAHSASKKKE